MIYAPLFDGFPIFGLAVKFDHQPDPLALQIDSFFGVSGTVSLNGGSRGRTFTVTGVLFAITFDLVVAAELAFYPGTPISLVDGIARTLTDTSGVTWLNVIYTGIYQRTGEPRPAVTAGADGWEIPYRCQFKGLG